MYHHVLYNRITQKNLRKKFSQTSMHHLILSLLLITLVSSRRLSFTLQYEGVCDIILPRIDCSAIAQSEIIYTTIQAHGNPETEVDRAIGSVSVWTSNGTMATEGVIQEVGTVSFGIHTTHESHTISYTMIGRFDVGTNCASGWTQITGGTGTLEGATGNLLAAACYDPFGNGITSWLSGFIIVDDTPKVTPKE